MYSPLGRAVFAQKANFEGTPELKRLARIAHHSRALQTAGRPITIQRSKARVAALPTFGEVQFSGVHPDFMVPMESRQ
jgi:hypothetical protein